MKMWSHGCTDEDVEPGYTDEDVEPGCTDEDAEPGCTDARMKVWHLEYTKGN